MEPILKIISKVACSFLSTSVYSVFYVVQHVSFRSKPHFSCVLSIVQDMATDKKSKPLLVALESLKHATESIEMHMQAGSDLRQTWQEVQDKRLNTVNTLLAMVATVFLPLVSRCSHLP